MNVLCVPDIFFSLFSFHTTTHCVILFGHSEMSFMCFVLLCGKVFAAAFSASEVSALLKKFKPPCFCFWLFFLCCCF